MRYWEQASLGFIFKCTHRKGRDRLLRNRELGVYSRRTSRFVPLGLWMGGGGRCRMYAALVLQETFENLERHYHHLQGKDPSFAERTTKNCYQLCCVSSQPKPLSIRGAVSFPGSSPDVSIVLQFTEVMALKLLSCFTSR